jgi:diacylglycerol kinase (ATP)
VTMRRAKTVSLAAEDVTVYADGEYIGELPIGCQTVQGAVQVLA